MYISISLSLYIYIYIYIDIHIIPRARILDFFRGVFALIRRLRESPQHLLVSGDYTAATDGLSIRENQRCLSSYLDASGAQARERELCSAVLGAHLVSYPKEVQDGKADLSPFVMQTGQLIWAALSHSLFPAASMSRAIEPHLQSIWDKTWR